MLIFHLIFSIDGMGYVLLGFAATGKGLHFCMALVLDIAER